MAMRPTARLGLIVNPIAGMGGRVGLKGTDGPGTADRARALGATPLSPARALAALGAIAERLAGRIEVVAAPGAMGEEIARTAGFVPRVAGRIGSRIGYAMRWTNRIIRGWVGKSCERSPAPEFVASRKVAVMCR